jgi:hypothetical protein
MSTGAVPQVAAAENLIDALQLPEEFDSAALSNPTLQRFYEARTHTACKGTASAALRALLCPCWHP